MTSELEAQLEALEVQLAAEPGSESLLEEILFEYLAPGLAGAPRRIHHAIEYVRRFPRTRARPLAGIGACTRNPIRAKPGVACARSQ